MKELEKSGERATKAWVLALVSVASFMVFLDAMVVTTALSTIRRDLGASIQNNCTHGSDAPDTAAFEIAYFFASHELL